MSLSDALQQLQACLDYIPQAPYPNQSRIHPLRSFLFDQAACFVKREDELGFALSGSKARKYRTLIPDLLQKEVKEAVVIGSAYSNHVLSLTQLLIENDCLPTLFLRGDPQRDLKGNALLTSLLVPVSSIHWFSKAEWKDIETLADRYVNAKSHKIQVIPEGACMPEALPGALSLALDIIRNEQDYGCRFNHILIDSGTGLTAIALILAYAWMKKPTMIHVLLVAGDQAYFLKQLNNFYQCFCLLMQKDSSQVPFPSLFRLYHPRTLVRFGQINQNLFKGIIQTARLEGFLTDPIYTAKLFEEAKQIIAEQQLQGQILLIHSGGGLTLMGFEEELKDAASKIKN